MEQLSLINLKVSELTEIIEESVKRAVKEQPKSETVTSNSYELLSIKNVCELFSVSRVTIHSWKQQGLIPSFKVGNRVYFNKEEVMLYMSRKKNIKY